MSDTIPHIKVKVDLPYYVPDLDEEFNLIDDYPGKLELRGDRGWDGSRWCPIVVIGVPDEIGRYREIGIDRMALQRVLNMLDC